MSSGQGLGGTDTTTTMDRIYTDRYSLLRRKLPLRLWAGAVNGGLVVLLAELL
jgi:hypothetical protein